MGNTRPELHQHANQELPPVSDLTGRDVVNEGGKIAKDVLRTSAVWTLSGFLTQAIREGIKRATKSQ